MQIPKQKKMEMLRSLLLSRRFEEELTELCKIEHGVSGTVYVTIGNRFCICL
jgi:acetoin:2,6-dichlorophenolindophenol oxidoreductase subunit alpha